MYDKNNLVKKISQPNESTYYTKKPTKDQWDSVLNELWWLQPYIAKELWRNELPLAKKLYNVYMFDCIYFLLSWHIGVDNNWNVNVGNGGKWFKNLLDMEIYKEYIYHYSSGDKKEQWDKLLSISNFIRKIGEPLGKKLGYEYPSLYDYNVSKYIRKIYTLKPNAKSF